MKTPDIPGRETYLQRNLQRDKKKKQQQQKQN